jgi:hypothetical protein
VVSRWFDAKQSQSVADILDFIFQRAQGRFRLLAGELLLGLEELEPLERFGDPLLLAIEHRGYFHRGKARTCPHRA